MGTAIMGYIGIIGYILGLYWENGKENVNCYSILGIFRDNGTANGNFYLGFQVGIGAQL